MTRWENWRWSAVGFLGRRLLGGLLGSCRIRTYGLDGYREARRAGRPVIILVWHGRMLFAPYFFRKRGIAALVSPSQDGEIIARIVGGWGYRLVRGSSSHPIIRAWADMKRGLKAGGELIIIPDGPRGPDRKLKAGAVRLARETSAVLVPFSFSASRKRVLGSWDRFLIALPFSRIAVVGGEPVSVPSDARDEDLEKIRAGVESALLDLDARADACFGRKAARPRG